MPADKTVFMRRFLLMLGAYLLLPISFLLMTAADFSGTGFQRFLAYFVGIVFWIGTAVGTLFLAKLNRARKSDEKRGRIKGAPGIMRFFSCRQGKAMDILLIPVTVLAIVLTLIRSVPGNVRFVAYAAEALFLVLHSVFNGKNYIYLKKIMKG